MPEHMLPVRKQDLQLGQPVPYAIFDAGGQLLISAGQTVRSPELLETLQTIGMYANPQWNPVRKPAAAGGARVHRAEPTPPPAPTAAARGAELAAERKVAEIKLMPGTWLQIGENGASGRPKTSVRLIGWVEKSTVFLSSVNAQGTVLPFRDGETLSLKTMAGRDVVAFTCVVSKVSFTPVPHLILSYPEQVQRQQLRSSQRIDTDLIASLTLGGNTVPARLINLSAGGALLVCSTQLHAGSSLQLAFRLTAAGTEHTLSIKAEVRSSSRADGQAGIEFVEPGMLERLVLDNFIYHQLVNG
ncbi:protein YcgR [Andreprevotia lacus DSM 23236]|uniref:Protein YcgR n=1 Tax=Andreprevotia lacus DSM 23236 TaxID=1121001 RepID=A0A1W1WX63_9NEIS|nr:flagellar brake protein [Andreprevotia lacus]SMC16193.1 protein YcgR [Andreprevotia lacus DSM 23236]